MSRNKNGRRKGGGTVKIRRPLPAPQPDLEATPERLAQAGGANHMGLEKGTIEKAGQPVPTCRRFADSYVDRLHRSGRLTYVQWYAAEWYRERYEQAGIAGRVVANYGAGAGGGEASYGMPSSERQARARQAWRKARVVMAGPMLVLLDRVVLEGDVPVFRNGQQRTRFATRIADALQPLAAWLMPASALDAGSVSAHEVAIVE